MSQKGRKCGLGLTIGGNKQKKLYISKVKITKKQWISYKVFEKFFARKEMT